MKLKALLVSALVAFGSQAFAATVNVSGRITADTTWSASDTYLLNGYVFVANNATLTIEPGTVIKAKVSSGAGAAALVITRGSKIQAVGTADQPIIFTSELDQLNGNLTASDTGLWGGLVILGKASINSRWDSNVVAAPIEDEVEGFSVTGDDVQLIKFGGTEDTDNSGTIKYVSIRHGGAVVGTANEINGLTLGGVGSGTTIDYIEVFANKDDGIEFFGGTVNASHLVLAFGNDDGLDFDQGYRGSVQFVFSIQTDISSDRGDKGIEWDGATSPLTATPKASVTVANGTFIGIGGSGAANTAVNIRDNVEAKLYNSIFVNFAKGLHIESDVGTPLPNIKSNLWWSHVSANNTAAGLSVTGTNILDPVAYWTDAANNNMIADPMLRGISYTANRGLDPRPATGSAALTGTVETLSGTGLTQVAYKGAFSESNWAAGWTKLWTDGWFDLNSAGEGEEVPTIPNSTNKFINVSTRGYVGTGDQVMIPGFVIPEGQTQTVLIRGVGPGLTTTFGLGGTLADPVITVYKVGTEGAIATNDNWSGDQVAAISAQVGAFPLTVGSTDAAIILNLEPGLYTVHVSGKNSTTGIVLAEVYEID